MKDKSKSCTYLLCLFIVVFLKVVLVEGQIPPNRQRQPAPPQGYPGQPEEPSRPRAPQRPPDRSPAGRPQSPFEQPQRKPPGPQRPPDRSPVGRPQSPFEQPQRKPPGPQRPPGRPQYPEQPQRRPQVPPSPNNNDPRQGSNNQQPPKDGTDDRYEDTMCKTPCYCEQQQAYCQQKGFKRIPQGTWPSGLRSISFNRNVITSLSPNVFDIIQLRSLSVLTISFNEITVITVNAFNGLSNLRELQLASNRIVSIETGSFNGVTNLNILNLQNNKMKEIDANSFQGLNNLRQLGIDENQIKTIKASFFEKFMNLNALGLGSNPWKCDCKLVGLFIWKMMGNQIQGDPTCASPMDMKERSIPEFTFSDVFSMCDKSSDEEKQKNFPVINKDLPHINDSCSNYNSSLLVDICYISEDVYTKPGSSICLHCVGTKGNHETSHVMDEIDDEEGSSSGITTTWNIPDSASFNNSNFVKHRNGSLCINNIQTNDNGIYTCVVKRLNSSYTDFVYVSVTNAPIQVALGVVITFAVSVVIATGFLIHWLRDENKANIVPSKPS